MFWFCDVKCVDSTKLAQSQGLFCLSLCPTKWVLWMCTKAWEVTQWGLLTPSNQMDLQYCMESYSAQKLDGGLAVRPLLRGWLSVSYLMVSNYFHFHSLSFLGFIYPLIISFSLQFIIILFNFSPQLLNSFISARELSHFCNSDSLPSPTGERREWVNSCMVLNCWLWLNHDM